MFYYFEILDDQQTGWFEPDPTTATPYYVVTVGPKGHGPGFEKSPSPAGKTVLSTKY